MWGSFGLQKNPFDIKAVERYGIIPVSTFIGREENRTGLTQIIKTRNHSLSLIVGEKGIGKTSLGNIVRSDLSEKYFITLSEIDTQHDWSSADFVFHALGNIYETTCLISTYKDLPEKYVKTCTEIKQELKPLFEDENSDVGVQVAGFGFNTGKGRGLSRTSIGFLKLKMKTIVGMIIGNGYSGLILQFNNLDNIEEEKELAKILADLREFLVAENCHYIFLGNKTMEACFKANSKVNDCITYDVQLGPLSLDEIKKILAKRYDAFKIQNRKPTSPILGDGLELIHALYDGNIRQIFYSLDHATINCERILGRIEPLDGERLSKILFTLARDRIKGELQPRSLDVLLYILRSKRNVTNTEITKKLKMKPQNTSKYLTQLKENNLIVTLAKEGRNIYYKAVNEARWLLLSPEKGRQETLAV